MNGTEGPPRSKSLAGTWNALIFCNEAKIGLTPSGAFILASGEVPRGDFPLSIRNLHYRGDEWFWPRDE